MFRPSEQPRDRRIGRAIPSLDASSLCPGCVKSSRVASESRLRSLRTRDRPDFESGSQILTLADLFAGCGGLTLGVAQAANEAGFGVDIPLAIDSDEAALDVYGHNFRKASRLVKRLEEVFDGQVGDRLTRSEVAARRDVGAVHALVGGPPCQGHSDLNNYTRRADPKNELYLRMVRAAEVLSPAIVMIENVPTVLHDKANVVERSRKALLALDFRVHDTTVSLERLGVPQRRRRHVLLAIREGRSDPSTIMDRVARTQAASHSVEWAIKDLASRAPAAGIDATPRASATNRARMDWLLLHNEYDLPNDLRPECHHNDHSYKSMYGRLRWDEPAQTVTSGFGSIGQGRYMHPSLPRALTPHEAARLQGFPDYFEFVPLPTRAEMATMIGNAVPPALARAVFKQLLTAPWLRSELLEQ